jgi:methyl-accepting chemotaxis protein
LSGFVKTINEQTDSLTHVNESLVQNTAQSADQLKTIAELILDVHSHTEQNAESAREAESLTRLAKEGSNDGRKKMERMVQAMDSITKSADEIKKIIRVIDDIAFQTNLLALNAAVEAARAGHNGKGFAGVAAEVRNLASRSTKAAGETAGLIEESIRQVKLGSLVANETSDSLNVITDQVTHINKIVSAISLGSEQQAQQLGGMTGTVGQVSTTADANTQSVEEVSDVIAAVSHTAQGLEAVIEHFKANEDGKVMVRGKTYAGYIPPPGLLQDFALRSERS